MLLVALSVAFRHATETYLEFDATSHVLFLNQSVLADFDDRKKKIRILRLVAFQARVKKTEAREHGAFAERDSHKTRKVLIIEKSKYLFGETISQ